MGHPVIVNTNVSLTVLDRRSRVGDGAVNLVTTQITGGCTSHMEPGNAIKILGHTQA